MLDRLLEYKYKPESSENYFDPPFYIDRSLNQKEACAIGIFYYVHDPEEPVIDVPSIIRAETLSQKRNKEHEEEVRYSAALIGGFLGGLSGLFNSIYGISSNQNAAEYLSNVAHNGLSETLKGLVLGYGFGFVITKIPALRNRLL